MGTRNIEDLIGGNHESKEPLQIDKIERISIGEVIGSYSVILENVAPIFGPHITIIENRME